MSQTKSEARTPKPENPWLNILFNIALPVLILNKASKPLGAELALVIALLFPLLYGAYDFFQQRKLNWIALLGLMNVGLTGGFALSGLTGIWFAVKEAAFPALIGLFVFASSWTGNPFVKKLFMNPQVMNLELIESRLLETGRERFNDLLKRSTLLFSGSFLVSAILNFGLAYYIFTDLPATLTEEEKSNLLNEQIAEMTQWSFVVIMIPSMIILGGILWYLIQGLEKTTGLPKDQLFRT